MNDLADHDISARRLAGVGPDYLHGSALETDRALEHPRRLDHAAGRGSEADQIELRLAVSEWLCGRGHLPRVLIDRDVDDKLAGAALGGGFAVAQRILLRAVLVVGGAEEQGHWVTAHAVEEREWGQVELSLRRDGGNERDRARHDGPDEDFVAVRLGESGGGEFHAPIV